MPTILITGCGSGFDYRMAKRFATAGKRVYDGMRDLVGANDDATRDLNAFNANITVPDGVVDAVEGLLSSAVGKRPTRLMVGGPSSWQLSCAILDDLKDTT